MALATRPKPTTSHKKRRGSHHRHSQHYLKPYWPYLPMLIVMGVGLLVNRAWNTGHETRLQAIVGSQDAVALNIVIIASGAAFALFTYRHWKRIHRYINKGETFIYRNGWVDVTATVIFTAGFILTRPII